MQNITFSEDKPTYANVIIRLRDISVRQKAQVSNTKDETQAAFASLPVRCQYCKSKGWPGTSHDEKDCRTKKRDQGKKQVYNTEQQEWDNWTFTSSSDFQRTSDSEWLIDSFASIHITNDIKDLLDARPHNETVGTGGGPVSSTHIGVANIRGIRLSPVLFIPDFPRKLISIARIVNDGGSLALGDKDRKNIIRHGGSMFMVEQYKNLYRLANKESVHLSIEEAKTWHQQYGHIPVRLFAGIEEAPPGLSTFFNFQCESCIKSNQPKPSASAASTRDLPCIRTLRIGQLLHSDLCGPLPIEGYGGKKYILSVIDDFSRLAMTTAIRNKSDAGEALMIMIDRLERRFNCRVAELRTDFGGEYQKPVAQLKLRGITTRPTVPYDSETNAVSERFNRTIIAMISAQLAGSGCPKNLWPLAMEYATFVKNRIPHTTLKNKCPLEIADPTVNIVEQRRQFRPFGQPVYAHIYKSNKLGDRATEARIVGFTDTYMVYKIILPNKSISTAKSPTPRILETTRVTGCQPQVVGKESEAEDIPTYQLEIDDSISGGVPPTDSGGNPVELDGDTTDDNNQVPSNDATEDTYLDTINVRTNTNTTPAKPMTIPQPQAPLKLRLEKP